jgi:hypothetical protein
MKGNSPVHQLGNFVDRPWGVSEIGGRVPVGERGRASWTTTETGDAREGASQPARRDAETGVGGRPKTERRRR